MATQEFDIALDGDGDLLITGGDLSSVESTAAHQMSLILDAPGDYKQNPNIGVDAFNYIMDDGPPGDLIRAITMQFTQDGMNVKSVTLNNGVINSYAYYK